MKNKYKKHALPLVVIISIVCLGLITGCGDTDTEETSDMEITPEAQQQDRNTRGSDNAMEEVQTFEASLNGSNQVPEDVNTDASGNATVTFQGDSIRIEGEFSNLSSEYMASHIHIGAEGENGDPIQPLDPDVGDDKTSGTWDATYQLDESHISALKSDSLYINVHSSEFTGGEIRGQLTPTTKRNM